MVTYVKYYVNIIVRQLIMANKEIHDVRPA
jgi:hypothetical protein